MPDSIVNFDSPSSLRIAKPVPAVTFPPPIVTVADPPFVRVSIPTADLPVPPDTAPLSVIVMSPLPFACALIPVPFIVDDALTSPEVVIDISPAPELNTTSASPPRPVTVPLVETVESPVPRFLT